MLPPPPGPARAVIALSVNCTSEPEVTRIFPAPLWGAEVLIEPPDESWTPPEECTCTVPARPELSELDWIERHNRMVDGWHDHCLFKSPQTLRRNIQGSEDWTQ